MTSLRLKRGTTTQLNSYTGPPGELTVDTTTNQLRLHNGTTAGGVAIGDLTVTPVKTSAYNANVNELVRIDSTTGSFTITLPATPPDGARISFLDVANQCGTNPVLVEANGKTILGDSTGISLDANGAGLSLVFNNLTNNWSNYNMFSSSSFAVVDPAQNITYVDDVFSTYTYTGNGSTQTITNGIDLAGKGGLVWVKGRNTPNWTHSLLDTARYASDTYTKVLETNTTAAAFGGDNYLSSYNSSGFNLGSAPQTNNANDTYVSWTFRKAAKFFDVVTWTLGDNPGGNPTTQNHSLGTLPGIVIIKKTSGTSAWFTLCRTSSGTYYQGLSLNGTQAAAGAAISAATAGLTSTTFNTGTFYDGTNFLDQVTGQTYVAYLFAHDTGADGLIQCGSFTTDGSGNATVTLGWEPQLVLMKKSSATGNWNILDVMRGASRTSRFYLYAESSSSEQGGTDGYAVGPKADGFDVANQAASATYIYLAIRRPNKPPTLGTQVYNAIARTGTGTPTTVTGVGFAPDLVHIQPRNIAWSDTIFADRLRGNTKYLKTNSNVAEGTSATEITSLEMDGLALGTSGSNLTNYNTATYINHFFKRAPGVFDIVCYTGANSNVTVNHSLGVSPELIIVKSRNVASVNGWYVWSSLASEGAGTGKALLNSTQEYFPGDTFFNSIPDSSIFPVVTGNPDRNTSGNTYVAYLFATKAGISKVGSYTGNGSNQTINCGFTTGARFILIKRTDSTGDWYVWDTTRGIVAGNDPHLSLNTTAAEVTTDDSIDTDNSGFVVNQVAATNINVNAGTYIFLAFA